MKASYFSHGGMKNGNSEEVMDVKHYYRVFNKNHMILGLRVQTSTEYFLFLQVEVASYPSRSKGKFSAAPGTIGIHIFDK